MEKHTLDLRTFFLLVKLSNSQIFKTNQTIRFEVLDYDAVFESVSLHSTRLISLPHKRTTVSKGSKGQEQSRMANLQRYSQHMM